MENITLRHINVSLYNETFDNRTSDQQKKSPCVIEKSVPGDVLIFAIALLGIAANAVVIIVLFRTKKLRKPVYVGIGMLAIPDLIFLIGKLIILLAKYIRFMDALSIGLVNTVILTAYFTSTCHVVLLSLQQYFYLAHPLRSHVWFTVRKMWYISLATWAVSAIFALLYMLILIFFKESIPQNTRDIFLRVITNLSISVPVIALTVLFVLKRMALLHSLSDGRNMSVPVKRMRRLVGIVVVVYLLCTTPVNVRDIIEYSFDFCPKTAFEKFFTHASFVLLHCNFTVNPFLYFIMTPKFRENCKFRKIKTFCCYNRKDNYNASPLQQDATNTTFI